MPIMFVVKVLLTRRQISEDHISWEEHRDYYAALAQRQLQKRLDAIPVIETGRCYLLELPTEIREQILSYVLDWSDLRCWIPRSAQPLRYDELSLEELADFRDRPSVFCLNRQILGEAISVVLRRPLEFDVPCSTSACDPAAIGWSESTILCPMARVLKIYQCIASTNEKLRITPKLRIKLFDTSGNKLWPMLHVLLLLFKGGIQSEQMYIDIRYEHQPMAWSIEIPERRQQTLDPEILANPLILSSSEWMRCVQ